MKINTSLLPIKLHYFFFMAAMGPILPQLSVYGRQLGISPDIMGTVTGFLPLLFLISKPIFGLIVDIYRNYRKTIFMALILIMAMSYALLCFIPSRNLNIYMFNTLQSDICNKMDSCNVTDKFTCNNKKQITCKLDNNDLFMIKGEVYLNEKNNIDLLCLNNFANNSIFCNGNHTIFCEENYELNHDCLYKTWQYWYFIILMSLGTVGFNIINSISDAICFDVIGEEFDYGKQRVWGTIGFGITALIAGYVVNLISGEGVTYIPAFMVMLICVVIDLVACIKLKLPIMAKPENILKDIAVLLKNGQTLIFIIFAIFAGIIDSILVYFLFWYIEDLAYETDTKNIKLLEGLIVACETLGGEVIFFSISGSIIQRFGYAYSLSMSFMFYALRLALISFAPSPWWIVPIEFALQGPSYALTYTTIVAYANAISPPGASATMQGIAAGVDDGLGYAVGSVLGGYLYTYVGKSETLQIFAGIALFCSIINFILHKTLLLRRNNFNQNIVYNDPSKAGASVNTAE